MDCHCTKCHHLMHIVAICDGLPVGWLCQKCDSVWQFGVGWNPFIDSFDPEMLVPRYAR